MIDPRAGPGEAAQQAFRIGIWTAGVLGLTAIGLLYYFGAVTLLGAGIALVLLFPTYLLLAAAVLSKWLGLDKGISDLRPVVRERGRQAPWKR